MLDYPEKFIDIFDKTINLFHNDFIITQDLSQLFTIQFTADYRLSGETK